jgi:hypothetical protein
MIIIIIIIIIINIVIIDIIIIIIIIVIIIITIILKHASKHVTGDANITKRYKSSKSWRMTAALLVQTRWFSSKSPSWSWICHDYQEYSDTYQNHYQHRNQHKKRDHTTASEAQQQ